MIVALVVLVPLIVLAALMRLVRALWHARHGRDFATIVLAVTCRHLPADRADWGDAMCTELACIDNAAERRRFAIGGLAATVTARLMGRRTARPSLILVLAGVTTCTVLTAVVLIGYPSLRGSPHVPLTLAVLAATLAGYTALAAARTADVGTVATTIRRWSVLVGCAIAVTWFVFTTAWWHLHSAPLGVAVLIPMIAGAIAARATGSTRAGVTMSTLAGLIGGIIVFIAQTIEALATSAGSGDGSRTSEVGEGLAISLLFLLLVPCLTVVAGTIGAVIGNVPPRYYRPRDSSSHS